MSPPFLFDNKALHAALLIEMLETSCSTVKFEDCQRVGNVKLMNRVRHIFKHFDSQYGELERSQNNLIPKFHEYPSTYCCSNICNGDVLHQIQQEKLKLNIGIRPNRNTCVVGGK